MHLQEIEESELHLDVKGKKIRVGARVAYGDWGHRIWTGTVKRYNNGNIHIAPDEGLHKGLWRLVQNGNSEKMIMVL